MEYRDDLPEDCPPPAATVIEEELVMYRLLWGDEPTEEDFKSKWQERVDKGAPVPEDWKEGPMPCDKRGLSVFSTWDSCEEQRRRDSSRIGRVVLNRGAGAIRPTHGHHFLWWPAAGYDILARTEVEVRR